MHKKDEVKRKKQQQIKRKRNTRNWGSLGKTDFQKGKKRIKVLWKNGTRDVADTS